MLALTSFSVRRSSTSSNSSSSSSLSLSPSGWTPSRSTISPPSVSSFITSSPSDSESELLVHPKTSSTVTTLKRRPAPRALSPPPSSFTTTAPASHQACAFPSWPTRDSLTPPASTPSPTSSYFSPCNALPSSRISDHDLETLDFSTPPDSEEEAAAGLCISWSQVGTGAVAPVQQPVFERKRRLPPPPAQYRGRNSSKAPTRKSTKKQLVAITE